MKNLFSKIFRSVDGVEEQSREDLDKVPTPLEWSSHKRSNVIRMIVRDFYESRSGEEVKFITGEGNTVIWNHGLVKKATLEAMDRGVKIRCIVGPVMKAENGYNFLLEQALQPNPRITMYVAPRREPTHYRIYGERKLWIEKYHEPLAKQENRRGRYVLADNPFGVFTIQKYLRDFEVLIRVYKLEPIKNDSEVILLEEARIEKIRRFAKEREEFVDHYERPKLEEILSTSS